ncbi:MAG: MarR family winged helix-turn-helix transcriptional regulator [Actinomycetota bacterium]|nr:MarR family winged helix-turn-helix transcriptional regulator [Actinomycetota bacterium]
MTSVNQVIAPEEQHAPMLMGLLLNKVRAAFAGEDWGGLRQSHFRVMTCVPAAGISITDLGERVGMTKQGCGQFVSHLVDTGHLKVERDPDDRRTRIVKRTALGNRTVKRVSARILRVERAWAARVGDENYQTFRHVLDQLALDD